MSKELVDFMMTINNWRQRLDEGHRDVDVGGARGEDVFRPSASSFCLSKMRINRAESCCSLYEDDRQEDRPVSFPFTQHQPIITARASSQATLALRLDPRSGECIDLPEEAIRSSPSSLLILSSSSPMSVAMLRSLGKNQGQHRGVCPDSIELYLQSFCMSIPANWQLMDREGARPDFWWFRVFFPFLSTTSFRS